MTISAPRTETTIPCPSWCTVDHTDGPSNFHASDSLAPSSPIPFRIWQADESDAVPGITFAGEVLSQHEALSLALAIVSAVEELRR